MVYAVVAGGLAMVLAVCLSFLGVALLWTHRRIGSTADLWDRLGRIESALTELDESYRAYVKRVAVRTSREKSESTSPHAPTPGRVTAEQIEAAWAREQERGI